MPKGSSGGVGLLAFRNSDSVSAAKVAVPTFPAIPRTIRPLAAVAVSALHHGDDVILPHGQKEVLDRHPERP